MDRTLDEQAIVAYLKDHPDFFKTHYDILEELVIPHPCGGVVSLIERQVEVLQMRLRTANDKTQEMITIARENNKLSEKVQLLTLELIKSRLELSHLVQTFHGKLHEHFKIEMSNLLMFGASNFSKNLKLTGLQHLERKTPWVIDLERIFESPDPICGQFQPDQIAKMFPIQVGRIGSVALVPLFTAYRQLGILALGSVDKEHFHPHMGTHFLSYLGAVLTQLFDPLLKP